MAILSGGSRGDPLPCLSQFLEMAYIPWLMVSSLHLQSYNSELSPSYMVFL